MESLNIDSLAEVSNGALTETDIATNSAKEGDPVGNYVWTLGEIAETGGNNVNDLLNVIGFGGCPCGTFRNAGDIHRSRCATMAHTGAASEPH